MSSDTETESIGAHLVDFSQYDSTFFIQKMDSADILYLPQQKEAKMVGQYLLGDAIGEGSYGKVKEGFDSDTLQRVAIKIMKTKKLRKIPGGEENVKREISLLKRLKHNNIVKLLEVLYNDEKQKMYVVLEYCAGQLQTIIDKAPEKKLPLSQIQHYLIQLVEGVGYLHSKSVIHRDIKPQNLLIAVDGTLKISDFGVADELDMFSPSDICGASAGTPAYQPPEIASGKDEFSGTKVDVWSIGVTFYHMLTGKYPFEGENVYTLYENIANSPLVIPTEFDSLITSLLAGMLNKDPDSRMSINDLANHP
ncbi:kinase-like protein [Rozella allomycis CSF55]|nr:kinase-like protein [Rozella allomycis CSF55]